MWKYTSYRQKGLSHEASGTVCQDNVLLKENEHCIVAALADGLGSLKHSDIASSVATQAVWELFASVGANGMAINSEGAKKALSRYVVQYVAERIQQKAMEKELRTEDMDCTLVFAYISKVSPYAITGRLGDSALCVIRQGESLSLNDGGPLANGTCAVLDKDAYAHLDIGIWNLDEEKIQGFILTSDGLDGEIYGKGSPRVNKAAEDYFNAVRSAENPQSVIQRKIAELIEADSSFDDDISIAVVSRAEEAITLPEDPTWLCTCGTRNRLQDTYCCKCWRDFSVLYRNIRFREYGGKDAFFLKVNRDPEREKQLIGLCAAVPEEPEKAQPEPAAKTVSVERPEVAAKTVPMEQPKSRAQTDPVEQPEAAAAQNVPTPDREKEVRPVRREDRSGKRQKSYGPLYLLAAAAICCCLIGVIVGGLLVKGGLEREIRSLSGQLGAIQSLLRGDQTEPEFRTPENILTDENGCAYYWGETKDSLPNGQGVSLKNGYYFIGGFEDGKKDGEFWIISAEAPDEALCVRYEDDALNPEDSKLKRYFVKSESLEVYNKAGEGEGHNVIGCVSQEDAVYKMDTSPITENGEEWVQIICGDVIGWIRIIREAPPSSAGMDSLDGDNIYEP